MTRILTLITALIVTAALIALGWLFTAGNHLLSAAEVVQASIALFACAGALISATFLVWGYLHSLQVFAESKRPQLLVQVVPGQRQTPEGPAPATVIHYNNVTENRFADLTIGVKVTAGRKEIDLSHLFRPNMVMLGRDARQRVFDHMSLLSKEGLDLNTVSQDMDLPTLSIQYSYSFNGQKFIEVMQEYKWDPLSKTWEIK